MHFRPGSHVNLRMPGPSGAPAAGRQSRLLVKMAVILTILASIAHLFIGADPIVVCIAAVTFILSICPIALCGFLNMGAVLVALVGLRYVGVPIFAKLAMEQPLNSNLLDPRGSFLVVFVGVVGYLAAFVSAANLHVGRSILRRVGCAYEMGRMSLLAGGVGIAAAAAVAVRVGVNYSGISVANFFTGFVNLGLIFALARNASLSKRMRSLDWRLAILVAAEVALAAVSNRRMPIINLLLCFLLAKVSFDARIRWRQVGLFAAAMAVFSLFVTPVLLYVRGFRSHLGWSQRVALTVHAAENWRATLLHYRAVTDIGEHPAWFLDYYGAPENVLQRVSLVNHVDAVKGASDGYGRLGARYLLLSFNQAIPRIFNPDKLQGCSLGCLEFRALGFPSAGPYSTLPLIGEGYADFGWIGAFCFPLFLGFAMLIVTKKLSGWDLHNNVWAIFFLIIVSNPYVEGTLSQYSVLILRTIPQDLLVIWILRWLSALRLKQTTRMKGAVYGGELSHTHR